MVTIAVVVVVVVKKGMEERPDSTRRRRHKGKDALKYAEPRVLKRPIHDP